MFIPNRPFRTGITVASICGCLFAAIAVNALASGPMASLDTRLADDFRQADHAGLIQTLMIALTSLGSVAGMTALCTCGVSWHLWRGPAHRRTAFAWVFVMIAGAFLIYGSKEVFQRQRPPLDWRNPVAMETNPSFPSGHAMGAMMGIGFLAYALCSGQTCRRRRLAIIAVLGALILGIGFSRIYLRAHWLSDVVGGFVLGLAWLSVCIGFLEMIRHKDQKTRRPGDKEMEAELAPVLSNLIS